MVTWITPTDVTPGTTGSWVDVDVSGSISASATGVFLILTNGGTGFNVRKNGSTDNRLYDETSGDGGRNNLIIGVDGSGIFEAYIQSGAAIYLVGYTEGEASFFTNATDISLSSFAAWTDIDISSDTGADTATVAFIEGENTSSQARNVGFRKNGSTDNRVTDMHSFTPTRITGIVGCDANEIFEGYAEIDNVNFYLTGYATDGFTINTNATDISLGTTGSYVDFSALPSGATGGLYEIVRGTTHQYSIREKGDTNDLYEDVPGHDWGFSKADSNRIVQGKIETTDVDFFELGYTFDIVGEETIYNAIMFGNNF